MKSEQMMWRGVQVARVNADEWWAFEDETLRPENPSRQWFKVSGQFVEALEESYQKDQMG